MVRQPSRHAVELNEARGMPGKFDGKVALLTGAGSGIGRAVTLRLASEGAAVLAVDVDGERLKETHALASGKVVIHQADLGDPGTCDVAVAACADELGRLDVLGNIAGVYLAQHATKVTREQYRHVMAVNLDACFFLAQAAIPHLLEAGGSIINIASNAGLMGVPYSAVYCMSKGGIVQLTRALAVEYLKTPLRVNAIAPAGTNTNIAASTVFPDDMDPELARRMAGHRGMAEPEEIAAVFSFLASDDARSVTGAIYTVDNGLTAS
jgi:NAD(P)-dependent dehydrogenase (short-subunit alcohol dehydrogenase family)